MKNGTRSLENLEITLLQTRTTAVHAQHVIVSGRRRHPVMSLGCEPVHGFQRLGDMHAQKLWIALIVGDAHHLVPDLGLGTMRQTALEHLAQFRVRHVAHQRAQIIDAIEREAEVTRHRAVAATLAPGCFLDNAHALRSFERSVSRRAGGVTAPDDQHIVMTSFIRHDRNPQIKIL